MVRTVPEVALSFSVFFFCIEDCPRRLPELASNCWLALTDAGDIHVGRINEGDPRNPILWCRRKIEASSQKSTPSGHQLRHSYSVHSARPLSAATSVVMLLACAEGCMSSDWNGPVSLHACALLILLALPPTGSSAKSRRPRWWPSHLAELVGPEHRSFPASIHCAYNS